MSKLDVSKYYQQQSGEPVTKRSEESSLSDILNKDLSLIGYKLNAKRKEWFYSELNILLSAGIDIKAALELMVDESKKRNEKKILTQLRDQVISGKHFSEVLRTIPDFSSYEFHSVEIGETTGRLNDVLAELAQFYASQVKLKRQIISVLSYPFIIILVTIGCLAFLLTTLVPMFKDIFKTIGAELPTTTKFIIRASNFASEWFFPFFLAIIAIAFLLYLQRRKEWFRKYTSALILRIPIFGSLIAKIYVARFCQSMKLLLGARTQLVTSLELVEKMIGYYPIEQALRHARQDVLKGKLLNESLSHFPIFSKRMITLLKIAEEVNQGDIIFEKLAKQIAEEVDHQNQLIGKLIEPIFIILLGLLVGTILVGMYLPMFQLSSGIGG